MSDDIRSLASERADRVAAAQHRFARAADALEEGLQFDAQVDDEIRNALVSLRAARVEKEKLAIRIPRLKAAIEEARIALAKVQP